MKKRKFYRYILYYLITVTRRIFLLLPYRLGFSLGGSLGKITFHVLPKEKKKTLSHLRIAFQNEKTERELATLGQAVFEHYGKLLAEIALVEKLIGRFDDFVTTSGYEHLDQGLREGKGIIITTAHFGNWEFMGGYSALHGYPLTVIARRIYFEKYDQFLVGLRARMKVKTIYRDASVKEMLGVLRKNGILGFVVDQDIEAADGIFVDFFGQPAFTPIAPVRFAMTTGAPIIPAFTIRRGMKHHVFVEPPIELDWTGTKEEQIYNNTQKWVRVQEEFIRRYPDQWVWNHRRWKTKPKEKVALETV